MAAYPSYTIGIGSEVKLVNGWKLTPDEAGQLHTRQFHGSQYYEFRLVHPALTKAQVRDLLATYSADPSATHTLTYHDQSPAVTYDVQFTEPPQRIANHGGGLYDVEVRLYGSVS